MLPAMRIGIAELWALLNAERKKGGQHRIANGGVNGDWKRTNSNGVVGGRRRM